MQKPISRKKYQEALRCLKDACKNQGLPWTQRIRAAELILAIYGTVEGREVESKRDRRAVSELVTERAFEKDLNAQVREQVTSKVAEEAARDARRYLDSLEKQQEKK